MKKINLDNITLGSDPEAFVIDKNTGEIVSAIGLIPGDKDHPHKISNIGHAIQTDNVMVEFNIPPAKDSKQMFADIRVCIDDINSRLPENLEVTIIASANLAEKYLDNEQAQRFGWIQPIN